MPDPDDVHMAASAAPHRLALTPQINGTTPPGDAEPLSPLHDPVAILDALAGLATLLSPSAPLDAEGRAQTAALLRQALLCRHGRHDWWMQTQALQAIADLLSPTEALDEEQRARSGLLLTMLVERLPHAEDTGATFRRGE